MKRTAHQSIAAIVVVAVWSFGIAGCRPSRATEDQSLPPVGAGCTVQFRRDALGSGANLPVPPLTSSVNGADTSVAGKIKRVTPEWLVIENEQRDLWIPRQVILLVRCRAE